jgi:predicted FMN-binding regulatory protein PaiB
MTGLEMQVTKVEAKYKLSQNKPESTRENVANHFRDVGNDLGEYMEEVK